MTMSRRVLLPLAVPALLLAPLVAFFAGGADLSSLAAAPYRRSFELGFLTAAGTLVLGLPAAWALAGSGCWSRWLRAAALAVMLVPPYLAASAWLGICWRTGIVVKLAADSLALLPLESDVFMGGFNLLLCAAVMSLALWPCVALPAAASLACLGREGREAAILARGRWACLLRVELPAALPAAVIGATLAFVMATAELGVPDLFEVNTAARDVLKGFEGSHDYAMAAGRSLPLLALALVAAGGLLFAVRKRGMAALSRDRFLPLPAPLWARCYATAVSFLALGSILFGLAQNAGGTGAIAKAVSEEYGLVVRSLFLALLSAGAAVALCSAALACVRGRRGWWVYAGVLGALSLVLLLPGTAWGLGLLRLRVALGSLGAPGRALAWFLRSPMILVWAGAGRAALGAGIVLGWGRRRVNNELLEAGRAAGLPAVRQWWLRAGLMRRHVAAALLLGTALALGELGAAVMIAPPGWETLPVRVFSAMHNYHGDVVAALALVTTAGVAILAALGAALAVRR